MASIDTIRMQVTRIHENAAYLEMVKDPVLYPVFLNLVFEIIGPTSSIYRKSERLEKGYKLHNEGQIERLWKSFCSKAAKREISEYIDLQ